MSKKYTLNKKDINKILIGAAVAAVGALLTYVMEQLPNINFGENTALVVAVVSIVVNITRKYITGK